MVFKLVILALRKEDFRSEASLACTESSLRQPGLHSKPCVKNRQMMAFLDGEGRCDSEGERLELAILGEHEAMRSHEVMQGWVAWAHISFTEDRGNRYFWQNSVSDISTNLTKSWAMKFGWLPFPQMVWNQSSKIDIKGQSIQKRWLFGVAGWWSLGMLTSPNAMYLVPDPGHRTQWWTHQHLEGTKRAPVFESFQIPTCCERSELHIH